MSWSELAFTVAILIIALGGLILVALPRARMELRGRKVGVVSGAGLTSPTAELFWTLIALLTGGAAPIGLLLVSTSITMARQPADMMAMMMSINSVMSSYIPFLILALLVLVIVLVFSYGAYPRLFNRAITGLWIGAVASIALDAIRYPIGVGLKTLPGDMPTMFGKFILGQDEVTGGLLLVGYLYHFLNGASFGIVYTLIAGKARWYWGVVWGLIVEVLMMTTPPMLLMGVGPFGVNTGAPWYFLTTLAAHIAFGVVLGLLAERFVKEKGIILKVLHPALGARS